MPHRSTRPSAPRIYLVTPPVDDAAAFARQLPAALDADIAAVLLRLVDADERSLINRVKLLAPLVQERGVALLLDGHANIVARGGADGAHLTGYDAFSAALGTLKPDRIAGCGGLETRHDAMLAAEGGADYVMFGDALGGHQPPFDAVGERVAWWAEVFEVPCVGVASKLHDVGSLAASGADFIAVGDFIWSDPAGPAAALAAVAERLAGAEVPA